MTNWNEDFKVEEIDAGASSMWIKVIDSWLLGLAFFWSMIAPKIFTGRQFS